MKKNIILGSFLIASSLLFFSECKKKTEVDDETQTVVDNAICEQQFITIAPTVNNKGTGSPKQAGFRISAACDSAAWIFPNTTSVPNGSIVPDTLTDANGAYTFSTTPTFTLDYSPTSCADKDGITKKGKMYITSTHKWSVVKNISPAITHTTTITFDNYMVDGIKYEGTVTLIKTGNKVTTKVANGHCKTNNWDIYYSTEGKTVELLSDGSIKVWGDSKGTNREGRTFTTSISENTAIIKKPTCKFISSGAISVTPDGFKTRTVDFGSGACDDDATFTVNGQTVSFKLK